MNAIQKNAFRHFEMYFCTMRFLVNHKVFILLGRGFVVFLPTAVPQETERLEKGIQFLGGGKMCQIFHMLMSVIMSVVKLCGLDV